MAKKKQDLTPEERLAAALVPKEEWPYALPDGWKWVRVKGLCKLNNGKAFKPKDWKENGVPIVRIQNLNDSTAPYHYYDGDIEDKFHLYGNELLFAWSGTPGTSFGAHIWRGKEAVLNQHIFRVDFDDHLLDKKFFKYALNQQLTMLINKAHGGAGLQHVTKGAFEATPICVPPLSEQRRLVARIESLFAKLDAAREKVQSVLDSHETRKAALLHDAFTGKLTAKWREEQGITFESWHSDTLKNLCEKITDGTHHSPPNAETGDYMYITAKNIKETGIELDNVTYVTTAVHKEIYSRCDVQKGDVLYIKDGATTGIATVNTLDEPFSLLSSVAVLRPHKDLLLSSYLKHLLNSAEQRSKMIRNMSGNAITRLTLSKIKATSIKVCSLPEQQEIVRILDRLLAREQRARQAAEETLAAIDRMKQSILARAFRGEL